MSEDGCRTKRYQPSTAESEQISHQEPVAIIGIGCRFPGAKGPDAYWQLIREGIDSVTEIPQDRFDVDFYYDPTPGAQGKLCTRYGGFIEDIDKFDPYFFGISPREAKAMDPQQRLLLQVAWEALEDAGLETSTLSGSRTGIFVGMCNNEYVRFRDDPADFDIYFAAGNSLSVLSGRLSFALGFQGPSMALDTACSTSLVAVHLACKSLWEGESGLSLAGGLNLILTPGPYFSFSQAGMLAPDGRCKFGDASAEGFVRSEGAGVVVLKLLSHAQADGDPIYALIKGSAMNNDGRSGGLMMTPSQPGQQEVIKQAYQNARIDPSDVDYVEAHGTGTSVGDPVELQAIGSVMSKGRPENRPLILGSVKTNIGHTEGASGIAGLIKVALSLKNKLIPPSLHFKKPNPNIPWKDLSLAVQTELGPWPAKNGPAIAGVSSFGISGTNAHVVMEEAPENRHNRKSKPESNKARLLTVSAQSAEALEDMVRSFQKFVSSQEKGDYLSFQDICYTAAVRRTHHDERLAIVAHSNQELSEHFEAFIQGERRRQIILGNRNTGAQQKIVFVFSPTGSQWVGMGNELYREEPVFRDRIDECDRLFKKWVDWSLIHELNANASASRLEEVNVMQPVLFAMQVALSALWRSWGIEPDAVVGHSMGEIAAAHVAGILDLDDAARIICVRSLLVKKRVAGHGGMAVIELPLDEVNKILDEKYSDVSVAACNGPTTTVISGDPRKLEEILSGLDRRGIFCQLVKVDYASHSPQMDSLRAELIKSLKGIKPQSSATKMVSTVTANPIDGSNCDGNYWMQNLRQTVLFSQAVDSLIKDGYNTFLEISPHPILSVSLSQCLRHRNIQGTVLPSLRREEEQLGTMLATLGSLYVHGCPVDWKRLYPNDVEFVRLPTYAWQNERYWIDDHGDMTNPFSKKHSGYTNTSKHPLLGLYINSSAQSGTHLWQMELGTKLFPYLNDHRVQGSPVLPAAAYLEIALAAASEVFGEGSPLIEDVNFKKVLFLPEDGTKTVQLVVSSTIPGKASFEFYSIQEEKEDKQLNWNLHTTGSIRLMKGDRHSSSVNHELPQNIKERCANEITGEQHYNLMERCGIQYGLTFKGVDRIWGHPGESLGRLEIPELVRLKLNSYNLHPAILDASIQVISGAVVQNGDSSPSLFLPIGINAFRLYNTPTPDSSLWSHFIQRQGHEQNGNFIKGDIYVLDEKGTVLAEAIGIRAQRLDSDSHKESQVNLDEWIYEVQWLPQERGKDKEKSPTEKAVESAQDMWLIFADEKGLGKELSNKLAAEGAKCMLVSPGDSFKRTSKKGGKEHYQIDLTEPSDMQRIIDIAFGKDQPPIRGILHLWGLNSPNPSDSTVEMLDAAQELGCFSLLHLVQALVKANEAKLPRLWLVTNGAHDVGSRTKTVSVAQAPLCGLGRVISLEIPNLRCTNVDLSYSISPKEKQLLFRELFSDDAEEQIAIRGGNRYIARLARWSPMKTQEKKLVNTDEQAFKLEISNYGILDDFYLRAIKPHKPGPGEITIRVYATGLNFRDVMVAMGLIPPVFEDSNEFGWECSGKIVAVGEGVTGYSIGDEVIAVARSCFSTYVTIPAFLSTRASDGDGETTELDFYSISVKKPSHLSFEEAATIPLVFMTAYYALVKMAGLRKGEKVLIHAGAGGVGQAAIQIAKLLGAEIFATAGSQKKRKYLKSQGVKYVMNSRSLDFADEIMELTNGKGVDVVLNSLAGEFIPASLSTLGAGGRFLEIGKVDILQDNKLGLRPFDKNISFFAIDLGQLFKGKPEITVPLFEEVMEFFEKNSLKPLPQTVFPISNVSEAFRYLAQAKHIGKVVVSLQEKEVWVTPPAKDPITFNQDASYLITGGLGGIGLKLAEWMAERGAKNLVLMGRSGASSTEAKKTIKGLKNSGVNVKVAKADVSKEEQVAKVLSNIKSSMPPLKGIIHAAGTLDDGIVLQLTRDRFKKVMAPKVNGAWILHRLTLEEELDFFLLFSSGSSLFASPGQGNYVAANSFLDTFAHYRRAIGLPALTLNWGLWAEVGMATLPVIQKRLTSIGILPFSTNQGLRLMERAMQEKLIQVMPSNMDWGKMLSCFPKFPPFLSKFLEESDLLDHSKKHEEKDSKILESLFSADPEHRHEIIESHIQELIAKVLGIPESRVDRQKSLMNMGLDSLMALELKNRVEINLSVEIPVTFLLKGPSIKDFARELLSRFTDPSTGTDMTEVIAETLEHVQQLSEEEAKAMLSEKH